MHQFYECHLETNEVCLSGLQELEQLSRVSCYPTLWDAWIFVRSQIKSLSVTVII
jgi:hypothetical protein